MSLIRPLGHLPIEEGFIFLADFLALTLRLSLFCGERERIPVCD